MFFKYRAKSSTGELIESTIEADDKQQAAQKLKDQNMFPMYLTEKKNNFFNIGRVKNKKLMFFFRQLASMESSGLTLTASLDVILDDEKNYAFRKILLDIQDKIKNGHALNQAMSEHKCFNSLLIALVKAGEEGGLLEQALDHGATLLEKQETLRRKIKNAMLYPSFIIFFAIAVLIFFFIFLVPKFQETFEALSIELPQITLKIFASANWFAYYWPVIFGSVILLASMLIFFSKYKGTKKFIDKLKLKIPGLKNFSLKAAMARSTRTFAALIGAGVPVALSVEMASGTANNIPVQDGYEIFRDAIIHGESLGDAAKSTKIFPVLICQMMRIGEETGHLDQMLERVASWYDQELDEQIRVSVSLIEPALIIFVGIIIAIIAISIFAPITSAITQIA